MARRALLALAAIATASGIKVGDLVPNIALDQGFPPEKVNLREFCKDKTIVLIPGYVEKSADLRKAGVDAVVVYAVNDGAVMSAWAADQKVEGSIVQLLADTRSEFTKALDLVLDHPGPMSVLGNPRCKRFSAIIKNGVFKTLNVAASEDDPAGDDKPDISLAEKTLDDLMQAKKRGEEL